MEVHFGQIFEIDVHKVEFVFDWCVRTALLELLVVFSVRDVALKKTALPGAGSLFAFLINRNH